jgi:hypothetical protein
MRAKEGLEREKGAELGQGAGKLALIRGRRAAASTPSRAQKTQRPDAAEKDARRTRSADTPTLVEVTPVFGRRLSSKSRGARMKTSAMLQKHTKISKMGSRMRRDAVVTRGGERSEASKNPGPAYTLLALIDLR